MDDNNAANEIRQSIARPRRSSFLSSLFNRSISISESSSYPNDEVVIGRTRGYSESNLSDFDEDDNTFENDALKPTATVVDASTLSGNHARPRSLTLSAMFLGARATEATPTSPVALLSGNNSYSVDDNISNETDSGDGVSIINNSVNETNNQNVETTREVSQTDHLNKRLLNSFLTRINSVAANIIDPSGTGETIGQVYTDDVVMDKILRRVESDSNKT